MSKEKEAILNFMEKANTLEVVSEEMVSLSLRIHEVYSKVLKRYLNSAPAIQLIYMEDLKKRTAHVKTRDEFADIVSNDLIVMKERRNSKGNFTKHEEIEFRIANKIYNDVVLGKGKEYEFDKLSFDYDGEKIEFRGFLKQE